MSVSLNLPQCGIGPSGATMLGQSTMLLCNPPSGIVTGNTANNLVIGLYNGGQITLNVNTANAIVMVTANIATFAGTSADNGRVITINDGTGVYKYITITAFGTTTAANGTVNSYNNYKNISGLGPFTTYYLGTPLDIIYGPGSGEAGSGESVNPPGIWMMLPSTAFNSQGTGFYWANMVSTTVGTMWGTGPQLVPGVNAAAGGLGLGIQTAIANGSNTAYTQYAPPIYSPMFTVPAGCMGLQGSLRITTEVGFSATAGTKTASPVISTGLDVANSANSLLATSNFSGTGQGVNRTICMISNVGTANCQYSIPLNGYGAVSGYPTYTGFNTNSNLYAGVYWDTLTNTDWMMFKSLLIEVISN